MKQSISMSAIVLIIFQGCASTDTGIVEIAPDTYMYSKQDWMAYSGGVIKAELFREANAFCASKGKTLVPLNSTAQDYAPLQSSASAEIQFACK
ncbi:hypothetical protein [Nitrospira moscoviensis]|uniref:hypothetical protein n=1 Tax=Nitrospira moscoviensis TaxID=42253 RepID=UPI0011AE5927|nr:hypothetical protein [Nitrospira moscoviensis]